MKAHREDHREERRLGLWTNRKQFALLVVINLFVGGMVGLERSILPQLAESEFGVEGRTAILAFIVAFGIVKAFSNYAAGGLAHRFGRKKVLIVGWLFALPVPWILMHAPSWDWVIFANVLLGVNQGLAWSSTVVMKIDLVGDKDRGLAMGINESAGYLAVGASAFATGWIAANYGLTPAPFYLGVAFSVLGLGLSIWPLRDTVHHMALEASGSSVRRLRSIFLDTSFRDRNLSAIVQAGVVNNLNDGMMWGLFPVLLHEAGFGLDRIGLLAAIYPVVWGLGQIPTGKLADHLPLRGMLTAGMLVQGLALAGLALASGFAAFALLAALLGLGTALVYPTFLVGIAKQTHPEQRARSVGVFRLWRDMGYAGGAIVTGLVADQVGTVGAVWLVAALTLSSGVVVRLRMRQTA